MALTDHQINLLQAPSTSIWLGYGTAVNRVEIVRLSGAKATNDKMHIDLFVPQQYVKELLQHLQDTPKLAFLSSSILTFEAFQVKGTFINQRNCNQDEENYQQAYLKQFTQYVISIGLKAGEGFTRYYQAPSIAIRMKASEVYEQTPKAGTGAKIS